MTSETQAGRGRELGSQRRRHRVDLPPGQGRQVPQRPRSVTAADFKYAWERICNPVNKSEIAYHLSRRSRATTRCRPARPPSSTGVKAVDDNTLEVTLELSASATSSTWSATRLWPRCRRKRWRRIPAAFADMPIGNGPFMMAEPWAARPVHQGGRSSPTTTGTKPHIDGIDFKIFKDDETAFLEFQAGNLDFTQHPDRADQGCQAAVRRERRRLHRRTRASRSSSVRSWPSTTSLINDENDLLKNADLRQALSLAINRQAICDTVYEGTRDAGRQHRPAGYRRATKPDAWQYAKYDVEAAKAALAEGRLSRTAKVCPTITLVFNTGAGHEDVMAARAGRPEGHRHQCQVRRHRVARSILDKRDERRVPDRPQRAGSPTTRSSTTSSTRCSSAGGADNYGRYYNDPGVRQRASWRPARSSTIRRAHREVPGDRRELIGDDCPVIPIVHLRHRDVGSDRVHDLIYSAAWVSWTSRRPGSRSR